MFISYRKLSYFILFAFFTSMCIVLYYSVYRLIKLEDHSIFANSSTISTFRSLSIDTDGNGKKDTINISIDGSRKEYKIEIISDDNKKYILMPDPKVNISGPYVAWWPLRITVADINMDNTPEIITQLSKTTQGSASYIFRWNGKGYVELLSGQWNGISLIDVNRDNVPEVITEERIEGTGDVYSLYTWKANSYSKINFEPGEISRGYDKIKYLTQILNSPLEGKAFPIKQLNQYFTEEWISNVKNIEYLSSFSKGIVGMQLQDYISEELESKSNSPGSVRWKLRYIVFRKFGSEVKAENYRAEIETEKSQNANSTYKIKNIKFQGQ